MSEREDNVYKAKLAEQAERYDGKFSMYYQTGKYFASNLKKNEMIKKQRLYIKNLEPFMTNQN